MYRPTKRIKINHPVSSRGVAQESRVILYDQLHGESARCYWCGMVLSWYIGKHQPGDAIVADHLDGDTSNNVGDNIVPSCRTCNSIRVNGLRRIGPRACRVCSVAFLPKDHRIFHCSAKCSRLALVGRKRGTKAKHGTRSRYVYGCRCDSCKSACAYAARVRGIARRTKG
jgi:hypothetical protein